MATFYRNKEDNSIIPKGKVKQNYPLSDQMSGQLGFDSQGSIYEGQTDSTDLVEIVDEEQEALDLLKAKDFDPRNFMNDLSGNSQKALNKLLSMQSNANPLKKGGMGVGFLCDILILNTRSLFDTQENTLFDIISAVVSTRPEDESYVIYSSDIAPYMPYKDKTYINTVLNHSCESMQGKTIPFDIQLPNGKTKTIGVSWAELLLYTRTDEITDDDESSYVAFKPTPLFKALLISSTIIHGAHYNLAIATQFKKHTRTLFYWFESKKNYKEYPDATPGRFYMSVEELRMLLKLPSGYRPCDVKSKILEKARKKYAQTEGMDFTFTYEEKKKGKTIIGFYFYITEVIIDAEGREVELKDASPAKQLPDQNNDEANVRMMLSAIGLKEREVSDVYKKYRENQRDIAFLTQAIVRVTSAEDAVDNKTAVLCSIMDRGLFQPKKKENKNSSQLQQREMSEEQWDELERQLLNVK